MRKLLLLLLPLVAFSCELLDDDFNRISRQEIHPDAVEAVSSDIEGTWKITYLNEYCQEVSGNFPTVTLSFLASGVFEIRVDSLVVLEGLWELRKDGRILDVKFDDDDLPEWLDDLDICDEEWSVLEASGTRLVLVDYYDGDDDDDIGAQFMPGDSLGMSDSDEDSEDDDDDDDIGAPSYQRPSSSTGKGAPAVFVPSLDDL